MPDTTLRTDHGERTVRSMTALVGVTPFLHPSGHGDATTGDTWDA